MAQPDYKFTGSTEDFECPICTLVVSSPVQTNCCGSVYCKSCIVQWCGTSSGTSGSGGNQRRLRRRSVKCCPNCRHTPLQYYDDKRTERMVKGLTVTCSNHKSGCAWTGELRNLSDHLNSSNTSGCQYQVVSCPNKCGETSILRSHLQDHIKEECTHRKVQCIYCQLTGHYKVIVGNHYDECPSVTIHCPNNCSTSDLLRLELAEHIEKCPLQVVSCEYSHAGCDKHMARKDIEIHQVTGMVEHLTLVNKKLLQLQEQIECKDHIVPIVFKMSNFSQQQSWASPCFYSHCNGYKLQLIVTVNRTASGLFDMSSTTAPNLLASCTTNGAISVGSTIAPRATKSRPTSTASPSGSGLFSTKTTAIASHTANSTASSLGRISLVATSTNTATCTTKPSTTGSSLGFGLMTTSTNTTTASTSSSATASSLNSATFSTSVGSFGHFGISSFYSNTGSLSISIVVKEGPFDAHLQWPVCARVTVKLLNQLQDSQHHSVTLQIEKPRPGTAHMPVENDFLHFIFCRMLDATLTGSPVQFLKDDSLYFQVTVELLGARQPQPWLNCTLVLT
ncbi:TNF receptor-associated factor 4-like [Dysidea avara]|uniref:TNF receptor-associated factor 4-like n=1 Tax=Dysidea avara TaxID=196820 RepID=UPI003330BD8A